MPKNFLGLSTTRRVPDTRSPQSKGKPAHSIAHKQVGSSKSAGGPASVPNRSGAVKIKHVGVKTPVRGGKPRHHGSE